MTRERSGDVFSRRSDTAAGVAYWRNPAADAPTDSPIVMLHGLGADHAGLVDLVAEFGDADTVAPDLPGYGMSAPLGEAHTVLNYAEAVEGLRKHLGVSSLVLVGHSLGANIALAYAGLHPARVRALALLHPVTAGVGPVSLVARGYYRAGSWLPPSLARVWLLSRPAVFIADATSLTTRDKALRREILARDYRAAAMASPRAISEVYRSLAKTPFHDLAACITAPTLLVTGASDRIAHPDSVGVLHGLIPRSSLTVVDGAGHLWPVEYPVAAADLIISTLPTSRPDNASR